MNFYLILVFVLNWMVGSFYFGFEVDWMSLVGLMFYCLIDSG